LKLLFAALACRFASGGYSPLRESQNLGGGVRQDLLALGFRGYLLLLLVLLQLLPLLGSKHALGLPIRGVRPLCNLGVALAHTIVVCIQSIRLVDPSDLYTIMYIRQ